MDKKITLVVGSGTADTNQLRQYAEKADFIIACDGGMGHCRKADILPNVIIGDFDSVKAEDKAYFDTMGIETYTYPTHKDMTDSEIGINLAIDRGATEIYLFGLSGTRLDHTITNINLLMLPLKKGIKAVLTDTHNQVELVDKIITVNGSKGDTVSLIPLTTTVNGITTAGLEYPLENAKMTIGASLGVSNVMTEDIAKVSVSDGILMVIKSKD
jgi:thiamine pyrophosphokinase